MTKILDKNGRDPILSPRAGDYFRVKDPRRHVVVHVVCPTADQKSVRVQSCDPHGKPYGAERIVAIDRLDRYEWIGNTRTREIAVEPQKRALEGWTRKAATPPPGKFERMVKEVADQGPLASSVGHGHAHVVEQGTAAKALSDEDDPVAGDRTNVPSPDLSTAVGSDVAAK